MSSSMGSSHRWIHLGLTALAGAAWAFAGAPIGAVLMKAPPVHLGRDKVSGENDDYYGVMRRGPQWENKYCAYRYQCVAPQTGTIDSFQKKKYAGVLYVYDDPNFDKNLDYPYGSDVMHGGASVGIGGFVFTLDGKAWLSAPKKSQTDSIVVEILDSSQATPRIRVGYYGWRIGNGGPLTAILTIGTEWESRITHCELKLSGNALVQVATGIAKSGEPNITVIKDNAAGLLASLGKQSERKDSMLVAVSAGPKYFGSFVDIATSPEASHGMILKPDSNRVVKWSLLSSWVMEPQPLFRDKLWRETAFAAPASPTGLATARPIRAGRYGAGRDGSGFLRNGKRLDAQGRLLSADFLPAWALSPNDLWERSATVSK